VGKRHAFTDEAMFWPLTTCAIGWNVFSCTASAQFEQEREELSTLAQSKLTDGLAKEFVQ
jgi:hypothetical protein